MLSLLKRYKNLLIIVALFVLPLFVYRANAAEPSAATTLDKLILLCTAPIERLMTQAIDRVSLTYSQYLDVVGARKENVDLRRKLIDLDRKVVAAQDLTTENRHLRLMLDLKERNPELSLLAAGITASGSSPMMRIVRIDHGSTSGVRRGMAVVAEGGLVGRVQRVGFYSAEVVLIADEKVSLDVVLARTRVRGRMIGGGLWPSFKLRIQYVLRTDDVKVGDWVMTSGLAGVYPRGVPVGIVSKVEASSSAQDLLVEVEPAVDFARLEHVMVILKGETMIEPVATPEDLRPPALRTSSTATSGMGKPPPKLIVLAPKAEKLKEKPKAVRPADAGVRDAGKGDAAAVVAEAPDAGVKPAPTGDDTEVEVDQETPRDPIPLPGAKKPGAGPGPGAGAGPGAGPGTGPGPGAGAGPGPGAGTSTRGKPKRP